MTARGHASALRGRQQAAHRLDFRQVAAAHVYPQRLADIDPVVDVLILQQLDLLALEALMAWSDTGAQTNSWAGTMASSATSMPKESSLKRTI